MHWEKYVNQHKLIFCKMALNEVKRTARSFPGNILCVMCTQARPQADATDAVALGPAP